MSVLIYRFRYAFHLFLNLQGMSLWQALRYPLDPECASGDPIEDAETEIHYMTQDAG